MTDTVWVLVGEECDYDHHCSWVVAVYTEEADALADMTKANDETERLHQRVERFNKRSGPGWWSDENKENREKVTADILTVDKRQIDPKLTSYDVCEAELR